jgi:hypothetical protein
MRGLYKFSVFFVKQLLENHCSVLGTSDFDAQVSGIEKLTVKNAAQYFEKGVFINKS